MAEENGIDREKFIAESVKQWDGNADGKLLAFLAEQYSEYKANILPLHPDSPTGDIDFENFDEQKNIFLEALWDVVQQHFDGDV